MRTKAFTLIEVMVVMAIISILAGMMMPAAWKFLESGEIATTRERMRELKKAMVGDRNLVQNGVRTHYGFVGDFGELPFDNNSSCAFRFLDSSADMSGSRYDAANWNGRYLSSSSDAKEFAVDAWGNTIKCTKKYYSDGRWVGLTLASVAPNGEILEETIDINDVIPTNRVVGNVFASYSSVSINIKPEKPGSFTEITTSCKSLSPFTSYTTLLPFKLPIGRIDVNLTLSKHPDCSLPTDTNKFQYFVQDNIKSIKIPDITSR
ncbi:MAG: prepilin-type N-terminal cleavage/methylation domain-containing protein [Geobacter sp.]|nr:prepilin-type N-terminal cleavage/methylation domain-containing protein [Geobacter sp.]